MFMVYCEANIILLMKNDEFKKKLIGSLAGLRQYCNNFTTNSDDADDLLQDTILKALSKCDHYKRDGNFNGWLHTIMHNTFVNDRKAAKHYADVAIGENDCISIDSRHSYREILSLIGSLPSIYRTPFEMCIAGYKYYEIAEMLQLPIGTVKSRINSARTMLKRLLH